MFDGKLNLALLDNVLEVTANYPTEASFFGKLYELRSMRAIWTSCYVPGKWKESVQNLEYGLIFQTEETPRFVLPANRHMLEDVFTLIENKGKRIINAFEEWFVFNSVEDLVKNMKE